MKVGSVYRIIIISLLFFNLSLVKAQVERDMVILEIATGIWCVNCPGASMGADDLVAAGCNVAVIEYHGSDVSLDEYTNDYSLSRINYYNIIPYPTAVFNGSYFEPGGHHTTSIYETYLPYYVNQFCLLLPLL